MATRGTGYLLLKDDCISTTEFNGDMYPDGFGDSFYEGISNVKSELDFMDFVERFNNENFKYDEDLIYSTLNQDFYDEAKELFVIDFNNEYFERFFSDWIFFKNLTGKEVRFISTCGNQVIVPNGNSIRFSFGELED